MTVPFFITHSGCPHTCIFCNQHIISGSATPLPSADEISRKILQWSRTSVGRSLEAAFFGGSFTALPFSVQEQLLEPVQPFLESGVISSIRISTRPDAVTAAHLDWLQLRGVRTIEIGVQSLDNEVLERSERGHDAATARKALSCIAEHGFFPVAQIMPGLPGDTPRASMETLKQSIEAGARAVRIYPAIVLSGTRLAELYVSGDYTPLTLNEGVALCKTLLHTALKAGVTVLRTGLQADVGLSPDAVLAGPWHPAFGQLVRSELYHDLLERLLSRIGTKDACTICCNPLRISDVIGHKKMNIKRLESSGFLFYRIEADPSLGDCDLAVQTPEGRIIGNIITDLDYSEHEVKQSCARNQ